MRVHLVYAHPSEDSFTAEVRDELLRALADNGHATTLSDLYAIGFDTDMTEAEYRRDAFYDAAPPLADDVLAEQAKVDAADALVFVFPVFWTEAPAKLVGWFDRVWRYGWAYGPGRTMRTLEAALVVAIAGNDEATLDEQGRLAAMRNVWLGDRIHDRARRSELMVLGGTDRHDPARREANRTANLARVRLLAASLA